MSVLLKIHFLAFLFCCCCCSSVILSCCLLREFFKWIFQDTDVLFPYDSLNLFRIADTYFYGPFILMILLQLYSSVCCLSFIDEILSPSLYFALFELPWGQQPCLVMSTEQPSEAAVNL